MVRNLKGWWRVGALAFMLGMAVSEILAESRQRRRAKKPVKEDLQNWENEGGAIIPPP